MGGFDRPGKRWRLLSRSRAGATQAQAQTPLTVVRVAGVQTDDITPLCTRFRTGMFARAGLDVHRCRRNSGAATAAAVASGGVRGWEVEPALAHERASAESTAGRHRAAVVHETRNPFAKLVVAANEPYRTGKDFDGKTIAVSALTISARCRRYVAGEERRRCALRPLRRAAGLGDAHGQWSNIGSMRRSSSIRRSRRPCRAAKCARVSAPYDAIAPFFVLSGGSCTTDYADRQALPT